MPTIVAIFAQNTKSGVIVNEGTILCRALVYVTVGDEEKAITALEVKGDYCVDFT